MNATRYRRRPDVLWRRSLDAVLCLPPDGAEPVTLAGSGPDIWELLESPRSLAHIAAELSARYDAEPDAIAADVSPVVQRLAALGLIEAVL